MKMETTLFQLLLFRAIRKQSTDTFVVMVEKTRLDHLAHRFYGNPNYWWIIANANDIKGTMYAKLGYANKNSA